MTRLRRLDEREMRLARAEGWPRGIAYEKLCEAQEHITVGQFLLKMARDKQVDMAITKRYIQWATDCGVKVPTMDEVNEGVFE